LRYTQLGRTDLHVSRICYGAWQAGGDWGGDEQELRGGVRRARELGVNFFDTAQAYGWGASERLLGEELAGELRDRRDELVIATKSGVRAEGSKRVRDASPEFLRAGIEDSLRFLGIEYVDLFQVHWPTPDTTPWEETAAVLDDFVREGKTRYVGVSNYSAQDMAELERHRKIDTLQPPYHLFRRDAEQEIFPYCQEHGIGTLVYGTMAHGLLSGKFSRDWEFEEGDWRNGHPLFEGKAFARNIDAVEALEAWARERDHTVAQVAVAWALHNPAVDTAIVGVRKPEHIEGTAPAAEIDLSDDDLRAIDEITQGAGAMAMSGPSPEQRK
jgi:aryl-alcohol dehydrogenase-like predicted oxidoreductase